MILQGKILRAFSLKSTPIFHILRFKRLNLAIFNGKSSM